MTNCLRKTKALKYHRCLGIGVSRAVVFLFFLLHFAGANAQVFSLEKFQDEYPLEEHLLYLPEAKTTDTALVQVRKKTFRPLAEYPPPYEPHRPHWLKITLRNDLPDASQKLEWVFHFSLLPTGVEYFAEGKNGRAQKGESGFFLPVEERTFKPMLKGNFGKIILPPSEEVTVFFKIKSERKYMGPEFEMELSHTDVFFENLKTKKQRNGIFVGFMLLIFIYNLFLFLMAKDRAFLYYSIYLFSLIAFTVYNTGDLTDWLVEALFPERPQFINFFKTFTYLIAATYLAFLRYFLDLKKLLPRWDKILKYLSWATVPFFMADVLAMYFTRFNYFIPDVFTIGYAVVFLVLTFGFLWPLYRTGEKKALFIVGGMFAMLLGILSIVINRFSGVDFSTAGFRIGTIVEVVIFSLGLAYRLRESEREKQQAGFELERNLILREQKEKEAQRLAEIDEAKSQFYTNITHEFRTPLMVISGMAENISGHEKEKELILRNSDQLLRQINQLLDLSKLEGGHLKLDMVRGDIIRYLGYLTESFFSLAEEKNIRLTFYPETPELVMDFDEEKLQHIVYNLLSNAIKFTPPGGKVILHARQMNSPSGPFLQMKVSDTGMGISTADLPNIFQRFYQGGDKSTDSTPSAVSTGQAGSGIGLALVKELVELMGGSIEVESEVGKGSEFLVLIPVRPFDSSAVRQSARMVFDNLPEEQVHVKSEDWRTGELGTAELKPALLLIEDNRDVAIYLKSILEKGYEVHWKSDGQAGIDHALEAVPDIIISDVMMPEKDGYEVCQTLKTDLRTSHVPIILLTAKANESDKLEGLKVGADAYLMKPFNKLELFIRLEKLLELRAAMRERYGKFDASTESPEPALEDNFLQALWQAVENQIDDSDFGVNDLCRTAGMSNTQLNRKLKALTGDTPSRFIRRVRMNVAKHLLQTTELNVSEVAYRVGFTDPNYFTRLFSEEFDVPPTSFRK